MIDQSWVIIYAYPCINLASVCNCKDIYKNTLNAILVSNAFISIQIRKSKICWKGTMAVEALRFQFVVCLVIELGLQSFAGLGYV